MVRKILVAFLLLASTAGAQSQQRWTTPGGGLYFGTNPPPGSLPAGEDMIRTTISCDDRIALTASREVEEGGESLDWSPSGDETRLPKWLLRGTARNTSAVVVQNLIVCAKDACDRPNGGASVAPGATVAFTLDISKLKGRSFASPYKLAFRCQEK